jgi:hypothetical protein
VQSPMASPVPIAELTARSSLSIGSMSGGQAPRFRGCRPAPSPAREMDLQSPRSAAPRELTASCLVGCAQGRGPSDRDLGERAVPSTSERFLQSAVPSRSSDESSSRAHGCARGSIRGPSDRDLGERAGLLSIERAQQSAVPKGEDSRLLALLSQIFMAA